MKSAALKLMAAAGVFAGFRLKNRGKAVILTYHRFSDSPTPLSTSRDQFEEHLRYLTRHYHIISLARIEEMIANRQPMPARTAAITIDDGYRDTFEIAYPLLLKYNAPATLFVVTDFLDRKTWLWTDKMRYLTANASQSAWETEVSGRRLQFKLNGSDSRLSAATRVNDLLKKMPDAEKDETLRRVARELRLDLPDLPPESLGPVSWDEARELDQNGVAIESHTITHPILTQIGDAQLDVEMAASRRRIESQLQKSARIFCYPNGDYGKREELAAMRAGYACAVSTEPGFNTETENRFALKRFPAENGMHRFVQATSGFDEFKSSLRGRA